LSKRGDEVSELQDKLFGEADKKANEVFEIDGQVTLNEAYKPVVGEISEEEPEQPAPEDLVRESFTAVERMKQEIAQENENLDKRFADNVQQQRPAAPARRRRPVYVIGVVSAAVSLIFMGIMFLISLSSPIGPFFALRTAPIMLIFIGCEIIFAVMIRKPLRIRIDIRSIIIVAALIALSASMSLVSVNASQGTTERTYAEQRIQNMLANELHDTIAKDYIRSVDIETQLYGENALTYETPADLSEGDMINITVNFADASMTIREFAKDCRAVLDDVKKLPYNFGHIDFIADDSVNHYTLKVDWHYQSDYSADRLAAFVNFFGDDISDNDIPDISEDE